MAQLPLFLNSAKLRRLLVGGGQIAARKLETLVEHGVACRIVALKIGERVQDLATVHRVVCTVRSFELQDLDGINLVISATNDRETNKRIAAVCEERAILINVVDDYALSTATFLAIVNRDPVLVAISTEGRSPTLARRLKSSLNGRLSEGLRRLAEFLVRKTASARFWYIAPDLGRRIGFRDPRFA